MKKIFVLSILYALNACTVYSLVEPGKVEVGDAYVITVNSSWSKSSHGHTYTFTKDGPALQSLTITTGIKEKDFMVSGSTDAPLPPYKKDLSLIEIQQFINDSMVALGAEKMEFTEIRPEPFGAWQGIRAEYNYFTKSGLQIRGLIVAAQNNDKFYYIMYNAPALHFFEKNRKDAEDIIQSVIIKKET
ncbi:MAG: hypothetical protein WD075_07430 [Rhodospirillales bacterium]